MSENKSDSHGNLTYCIIGAIIAAIATGYFAPESEKELTSRQNIARHALWLTHLVQVVADQAS